MDSRPLSLGAGGVRADSCFLLPFALKRFGGGPGKGAMNRIMAYVWYPAFLIAAIAGFGGLLAIGAPTAIATYLPIFVVGISILALEPRFPERVLWRPKVSDVKADAAFLALVQV